MRGEEGWAVADGKENVKMSSKKIQSVSQTAQATLPAISQAEVEECLAHLDSVATVLAPYLVSLTAPQRKLQSKGRKDVEAMIPQLATLATRFGVASASVNVDQMTQQAALASALQPLIGRTRTLLVALGDTVLQAGGNACHTATTVHSFLKRLAKKNGSLQGELSVVSAAFANKSSKAKAEGATEPTTAAATTSTVAPATAAPVTAVKAS
jgi:hypothetical protein